MEIYSKKAEMEDAEIVSLILRNTWKNTYNYAFNNEAMERISGVWHDEKIIANEIRRKKGETIIAYLEDKPVGIATYAIEGCKCIVKRLYVMPEYQRMGIGKYLLDRCSEPKGEITTLEIDVEHRNKKGIEFYLKNGFTKTEELFMEVDGIEIKADIMQKVLEI